MAGLVANNVITYSDKRKKIIYYTYPKNSKKNISFVEPQQKKNASQLKPKLSTIIDLIIFFEPQSYCKLPTLLLNMGVLSSCVFHLIMSASKCASTILLAANSVVFVWSFAFNWNNSCGSDFITKPTSSSHRGRKAWGVVLSYLLLLGVSYLHILNHLYDILENFFLN